MPEPMTLATLATLAAISAVGTGLSGYAQSRAAAQTNRANKAIGAGQLELGKKRLSQEDSHFQQKKEMALQQQKAGKAGNAMNMLASLGQAKRQQY